MTLSIWHSPCRQATSNCWPYPLFLAFISPQPPSPHLSSLPKNLIEEKRVMAFPHFFPSQSTHSPSTEMTWVLWISSHLPVTPNVPPEFSPHQSHHGSVFGSRLATMRWGRFPDTNFRAILSSLHKVKDNCSVPEHLNFEFKFEISIIIYRII